MLVVPAAIGNERMKGPAGREWKTRGGRGLPKNRRGKAPVNVLFPDPVDEDE
jgi:hypothetical protein